MNMYIWLYAYFGCQAWIPLNLDISCGLLVTGSGSQRRDDCSVFRWRWRCLRNYYLLQKTIGVLINYFQLHLENGSSFCCLRPCSRMVQKDLNETMFLIWWHVSHFCTLVTVLWQGQDKRNLHLVEYRTEEPRNGHVDWKQSLEPHIETSES